MHTHEHTLIRTDSTAREMKSCQSPKSSTKGGVGLNVPASRLLRTNTSIHRILYTWEIKNGWCKLQPSYKEPSCKLPSYTAAAPHCAPSAAWTHQCCSGWADHTLGDALHPGLPWYYSSHQVQHCFYLSTEAWLGFNKKAQIGLVLSLLFQQLMEQWQLAFPFNSLKYLHSLILAHPALPGAPPAVQEGQCSPKRASQHFPAATRAFSSQPLPKGHCPPAETHAEPLGWGAPRCSWLQGRTEPWGGTMQNIQGLTAAPTWFHLQGEHQHLSRGTGLWHSGVRHTSDRKGWHSTVQDILSAPAREWSCCGSHTFHPHTERRGNTCWKCWDF